jgi:hypothetical protein
VTDGYPLTSTNCKMAQSDQSVEFTHAFSGITNKWYKSWREMLQGVRMVMVERRGGEDGIVLGVSLLQPVTQQCRLSFLPQLLGYTRLLRPLGCMRCPDQLGSVSRGVGLEMG